MDYIYYMYVFGTVCVVTHVCTFRTGFFSVFQYAFPG